jgi:hypothetical protein
MPITDYGRTQGQAQRQLFRCGFAATTKLRVLTALCIQNETNKEQIMSISSQGAQQKFPFAYDDVFDGLIEVIPKTGFKLKSSDKLIGRISASTGWSLLSYGENITIVVEKVDDEKTIVGIDSALKVGINVAGAHRHTKNFNKIIESLSAHLQSSKMTISNKEN